MICALLWKQQTVSSSTSAMIFFRLRLSRHVVKMIPVHQIARPQRIAEFYCTR